MSGQAATSARLLSWYDAYGRELPWRLKGGQKPDPYRVWLSEIMLQQTTVAAVQPYFAAFTEAFPTVNDLAAAEDGRVMEMWAGLGYYARARNLLKCARVVRDEHGGRFPQSEAALLTLPGIGPYTAAAITAIAFNQHAAVVDGNIERVITRLHAIEIPLPAAKPQIKEIAAQVTPQDRPGDFAQAMMDLGATLCTPKKPKCLLCPWQLECAAHAQGREEIFPVKAPKVPKPRRVGRVFWLQVDGDVALIRRPNKGLLGGMLALPSSDWAVQVAEDALAGAAPCEGAWAVEAKAVRHVFTHFELSLDVAVLRLDKKPEFEGVLWRRADQAMLDGLPTVMRKAARFVLAVN